MADGDYLVQLYTRTGTPLGEVPCTFDLTVALRKSTTLTIEGRSEDRMMARSCDPLRAVLVLREEVKGKSIIRAACEVVDYERDRDQDGKGITKVYGFSPEWRWWSTAIGNLSAGLGYNNYSSFRDGASAPYIAPVSDNVPVLAWGSATPAAAVDKAEAAARLVSHAASVGYDIPIDTPGGTDAMPGAQALGIRLPGDTSVVTHDCGIRTGAYTLAGSTITTLPADLYRKSVGQLMDQLAGGLNGFEWWIDYEQTIGGQEPSTGVRQRFSPPARSFGVGGYRGTAVWGQWRAAAVKGVNRNTVVYEYGGGKSNVENLTERVSGADVGTAVTVPAIGGIEGEAYANEVAPTNASAAYSFNIDNAYKYGALDRILATGEISSYSMRKQLADDAVLVGSKPRQTFSFQPSQKANAQGAWPMRNFDVGDRVRLVVWERSELVGAPPAGVAGPFDGLVKSSKPFRTINGMVRVYGFTIKGGANREATATVTVSDG